MNIKKNYLSTLIAFKTLSDNEYIYDENDKQLFNIGEEITRLMSSEKDETPINRFNTLVNQVESVHSNLICTVIELLETTNGEALGKEITIDGIHGKINNIILSEMYTILILRTGLGDRVYHVKKLSNEDLISIGMLF